ncbi:MAG: 3-deoxy-7-phosphoheptulonate synthase [Eubacteriales bacterium]|nr:3-deoxy-7-phosphoheptulonate synthase [Eubacteriales bacterium]
MDNMTNTYFKRKLPVPQEIKKEMPLSAEAEKIKTARDKEIAKVFTGESDKFLLIIGPCSADRRDSVLDYIRRLALIQTDVQDKIIIIPRIYTGKPRTTGAGYKGMLHQPDPDKKPDMLEGIKAIRELHKDAIEETGLTCADEMLYPQNYRYLSDLLSYVAIGARSVENQEHRLVSSGMDIPVGMKNPTSGDLSIMLNSIRAAHGDHTFLYRGWEVESKGNPLAHAILRGSVSKHGNNHANYHYEDLRQLYDMYCTGDFVNPAVIVDTNHSNSGKKYLEQVRIANEVLHSMRHSDDIKSMVKGFMVESYIEDGCQKVEDGVYGKSITDPCLGWDKTKDMIYSIADQL